jgi:hypothetical protein
VPMGVVSPGDVILWAIAAEFRSLDVTKRIAVKNNTECVRVRSKHKRNLGMES